ncbi:serpin family protein [Dyadobacter sp. Leaf189]|uniref:serpin family protein n=1 Tax=Dyadobacter sp. Leaf189 TaxID=1736295 RepID=UPI0006F7D5D6|nr:serpin family protein [Dyadobacter sp. Leaf189]KQS25426.1 proteinase inhibitor I4 serpin [Dyadobacter sp. Leaf189]
MKILTKSLFASLLAASALVGCTSDEDVNPSNEVNPVIIPAEVADGSSRFAFNFLHNLQKTQPEDNFFVSPLSLHMALGMLLNGAESETAQEIQKSLEMQGVSMADLNKAYQTLINDLPVADSKVTLGLANSIWYKTGFNVSPDFQSVLRDSFHAEITGLPFNAAAVGRINQWASDKTNGKIKKVIEQIQADHVMFLLNALYFKGDWKAKFEPKETADAPFTLEDGTVKTVKMMNVKGAFTTAGDATYSAVKLPYGNGQFSMTILLPKGSATIDGILSGLDADEWKTITSMTNTSNIKVGLPRFKLEYSALLKGTLMQMGIKRAFSNGAEFGKINRDTGLKVDFVKQDTYLGIDEKGTEAAAVTSIGMSTTSWGPEEPKFICDRPFGIIISENTSNTILFMGRIKNPDSK